MPRSDPLRNFRFRLEIDGIPRAGFSEVTGFDATLEPSECRDGNEETNLRKVPGPTKYGNLMLKRGVTNTLDLRKWYEDAAGGDVRRKNLVIVVLDEAGADVARFEVIEAWPCKYAPMDLSAKGNDVSIETLEICHEGVRRVA